MDEGVDEGVDEGKVEGPLISELLIAAKPSAHCRNTTISPDTISIPPECSQQYAVWHTFGHVVASYMLGISLLWQ